MRNFIDLKKFIFHYVQILLFGIKNEIETIEVKHLVFFLII